MESSLFLKTSTKQDGNLSLRWGDHAEEVLGNRRKFLEKYQLRLEDCLVMEVEHGDTVIRVDAESKPKNALDTIKAEALTTDTKGVALCLLTADCLPVTLYDPVRHALALAHLGWRPTNESLLPKVIRHMQEAFGTDPKNLLVNIGPGIHKESYRHTLPLTEKVELKALKSFVTLLNPKEVSIDLVGCNKYQLLEMGVAEDHIQIDPTDTATSSHYFSHYRSVRTGEKEGRFVTVAYLR
jgi:polyphenol oxidase